MFRKIAKTSNSSYYLFIRCVVAIIFISEGIQKFILPERGILRFEKLPIYHADWVFQLVAGLEIFCGLLILIGLFSRIAAFFLLVIMCAALYLTKIPLLQNHDIWYFLHESRTDLAMLFCVLFLLGSGSGRFSIDFKIMKKRVQNRKFR